MPVSPKRLLIFLCLLLTFPQAHTLAQYNEMGIMLGSSNYKGELSPHLFNTDFLHFAGGGFYRHNWNRHWSWKLEVNYGRISGDDAKATTGFELDRNLSFYSDILEVSPQIEFNFFPYETGRADYPVSPYIFSGISLFHFNPKAELGGTVFDLQPLGTEGQGFNGKPFYKRTQFALVIGGGLKVSVSRSMGIGLEVGARRAYTDYLDDVSTTYPDMAQLLAARGAAAVLLSDRSYSRRDTSLAFSDFTGKQRGQEKNKDWYLFGGVTIYFRLSSILKDICRPFKFRRYH